DASQRFVPGHGFVAVRIGRAAQRLDEPALLLEPVVALLEQLADRPAREELAGEPRARGLVRHRLGPGLAEFGGGPLARIGPRTWFTCASSSAPRRRPGPRTTRATVEAIAGTPPAAARSAGSRSLTRSPSGLRSPSARCAKPPDGLRSPSARCAKPPDGLRSPSARCAKPPDGLRSPSARCAKPPDGPRSPSARPPQLAR